MWWWRTSAVCKRPLRLPPFVPENSFSFHARIRDMEAVLTLFHPQIFRQINSVTVPKVVGVPKNDEEDAKRGNQ